MSIFTDFHKRFSQLKNKRVDHSGARTKKRRVTDGRYIRLYTTIFVGYDVSQIHGQAKMLEGSYRAMVYPKLPTYKHDAPYMFVNTLIKYCVCFKYSNKTLKFCNDLCAAVRNGSLQLYEARSILKGESLEKAKSEIDYLIWQEEQFTKMRDAMYEEYEERE